MGGSLRARFDSLTATTEPAPEPEDGIRIEFQVMPSYTRGILRAMAQRIEEIIAGQERRKKQNEADIERFQAGVDFSDDCAWLTCPCGEEVVLQIQDEDSVTCTCGLKYHVHLTYEVEIETSTPDPSGFGNIMLDVHSS